MVARAPSLSSVLAVRASASAAGTLAVPAESRHAFLDLTALGRQEGREEPKGRVDAVREAVPDFSACGHGSLAGDRAVSTCAARDAGMIVLMGLIDLSHAIEHQMTTYPGLPGPEIGVHLSFEGSAEHYDPGTEFAIGRISMIANTGTYLDTPAHRFRDGHDLAGLSLERCAMLPAVVVDADGAIGPDVLPGGRLDGMAVLLRTGWDRRWGTAHYGDPDHPYLTEAGAQVLVERGATLAGIDSVNIDDTTTGQRPAHTTLLAAGIPVVEHLTGLHLLPHTGAHFTAVPPSIDGMATFPVRAFAHVP
ncbi:cyclase family protein [Haloechinothrix alba]|uniref:cyclase family protein n=1 Tax=Haloechinothrix alba TaxID=664784 RepID=UPI001FE5BFD9|nr:cyclase family protein [Haloechinothrix alba]